MRTIAEVCHHTVLPALERRASAEPSTSMGVRPRAAGYEDALPYGSAGTSLPRGLSPGRQDQHRAIGSAGERLVHTEEVTGSIPVSPTDVKPVQMLR